MRNIFIRKDWYVHDLGKVYDAFNSFFLTVIQKLSMHQVQKEDRLNGWKLPWV